MLVAGAPAPVRSRRKTLSNSAAGKVRREREVQSGDFAGAVRVLVDHDERTGDRVLRMLAEETRSPALRDIADCGRRMHREWCQGVFGSALAGLRGVERERRLAQLVTVCDVYTWILLRRQSRLSRRQTRTRDPRADGSVDDTG
jgi:hypothetical protein